MFLIILCNLKIYFRKYIFTKKLKSEMSILFTFRIIFRIHLHFNIMEKIKNNVSRNAKLKLTNNTNRQIMRTK